jgi:hypothetical protein
LIKEKKKIITMNFQITKLNPDFFHDSDKESFAKRGWMGNDQKAKSLPCRFRAWDDDGVLYFSGKVSDEPEDWETLFDCLMYDSGTTRIVFYDKKGKRIDEIS